MKKISAVILGYGDRGSRYADYAKYVPEELEIVGVIDTNEMKLRQAQEKFGLPAVSLYHSLNDFLNNPVPCDVVINSTMDKLHYETTMALLEKNYDILLEKPITAKTQELLDLPKKAKEKGCKVVVCHVLRYTRFYSAIKRILDGGKLGKIVSLQLNEHVWHGHFVNSYVRGK